MTSEASAGIGLTSSFTKRDEMRLSAAVIEGDLEEARCALERLCAIGGRTPERRRELARIHLERALGRPLPGKTFPAKRPLFP